MAADSWACSPTAVEAMRANPLAPSLAETAKSSAGAAVAPFTWVSSPASQASTMATLVSASELAMAERSSPKLTVSPPSSSPPAPAWPE